MINKILNSKAYQIFDFVVRLLILNVLIILISFSLLIILTTIFDDLPKYVELLLLIPTAFTILPSIVASTAVIKSYVVDKNNGLFKDFFIAFKKYYFKSLLLSILVVVAYVLLQNSYFYFNNLKLSAPIYMIGYILTISFSLIALFAFIQIPLVFVYFDGLKIIHYVKLAFILSFKNLGTSIILLIISVASIIASYFVQIYLLLFSFTIVIYFCVLLTKKNYLKITNKLEGETNEIKN